MSDERVAARIEWLELERSLAFMCESRPIPASSFCVGAGVRRQRRLSEASGPSCTGLRRPECSARGRR
jgi:hypothetical protein